MWGDVWAPVWIASEDNSREQPEKFQSFLPDQGGKPVAPNALSGLSLIKFLCFLRNFRIVFVDLRPM
jgi:hypothetical protein